MSYCAKIASDKKLKPNTILLPKNIILRQIGFKS